MPRAAVSPNAILPLAFRSLNRAVKPAVRAGLFAPPPVGFGTVLLTTTGRKSGAPREVPVAALRLGDTVFVSTIRASSQWMANLRHKPSATVEFGCRGERSAQARFDQVGPLQVARLQLDGRSPASV